MSELVLADKNGIVLCAVFDSPRSYLRLVNLTENTIVLKSVQFQTLQDGKAKTGDVITCGAIVKTQEDKDISYLLEFPPMEQSFRMDLHILVGTGFERLESVALLTKEGKWQEGRHLILQPEISPSLFTDWLASNSES